MTDAADDPFDLSGHDKAANDRARKVQTEARTEAEDLRWLMSGKRGRRVMWRLLDRAGVFRSSFTGNSETFFREGQRNIGLIYLAQVHEHAPEAYSTMIEENRAKQ
ncbi:hypothetical protein UFOVP152_17 [uncultured Caudovirales phage]|uniref:Bbp19-like phage domain-containing protein n=1 Tax=uncultured Caudovirales phage TaxID=2100421 RepID=A0A6J7W884_9CAUD|nr:hypothetical protein UFOVP152_17 [uncultured Caudovirales phage]